MGNVDRIYDVRECKARQGKAGQGKEMEHKDKNNQEPTYASMCYLCDNLTLVDEPIIVFVFVITNLGGFGFVVFAN